MRPTREWKGRMMLNGRERLDFYDPAVVLWSRPFLRLLEAVRLGGLCQYLALVGGI